MRRFWWFFSEQLNNSLSFLFAWWVYFFWKEQKAKRCSIFKGTFYGITQCTKIVKNVSFLQNSTLCLFFSPISINEHTGAKSHFLSINSLEFDVWNNVIFFKWHWNYDICEILAFQMWFLWKIRFWKSDFSWKMGFWNVIF